MASYIDADRRLVLYSTVQYVGAPHFISVSCAQAGDGAGVRAALRAGANHHLPGPEGRLPLHVAAAAGHADAITGLLQAGADLHAPSGMTRDDGRRAGAASGGGGRPRGGPQVVGGGGAPLDGTDDKGRTAVHWAALRGQQEALVTLHTLGCDPHALDKGHANALHFAAASGSLETVRWLVEVTGVSVTQTDHNDRSPYVVAKRKGHKNLLGFLKQAQEREQSQHSAHHRQQSQPSPSAWVYNQSDSQHQSAPWRGSQHGQRASVTRARSQDLSTLGQQQQNQHSYPPRPKSQHSLPAPNQHQVVTRGYSHPESASWDSSQRGSMSSQKSPQQVVSRQQESANWDSSQQNHHQVVTRVHSQPESARWNSSQHRSLSRQQSQRSTSTWVESQQERQHQEREEPRSALALLTQQNQDYKRRIAQLEEQEAQARQRTTSDQTSLAELRKEVERLTGILQSEGREAASMEEVAALREEVHHLNFLLEDTGRRALANQEEQQRKIESLKGQEELNQRTVAELTRRLTLAEESNVAMMAEARDRERSETLLRGEVDRLKLSLSSAPKSEAFAQLQARANRLTEQDTLHRQAILALRRQLEATRVPSPAPQPNPLLSTSSAPDQRRLKEALLQAEKSREEVAALSAQLQATQGRLAEAERLVVSYKRQLGECVRELREERERGDQMTAALREEVTELRGRMEAVKRRAVASLTRAPSSSDA
ncbi:ciliary rootlet coiled-coil protein 2-like [Portunus trituberculatus]|uniref:ciliary rootlet coiled-coil protein 2-like n=1 Tax=Portunus trituberculatus TaxID=210409 RepID=UPI001E1D0874|nr:ciliary rootlet coiled-coil protein 2-like [Portunus trituberculatus]